MEIIIILRTKTKGTNPYFNFHKKTCETIYSCILKQILGTRTKRVSLFKPHIPWIMNLMNKLAFEILFVLLNDGSWNSCVGNLES